jgi:hypothetical protein
VSRGGCDSMQLNPSPDCRSVGRFTANDAIVTMRSNIRLNPAVRAGARVNRSVTRSRYVKTWSIRIALVGWGLYLLSFFLPAFSRNEPGGPAQWGWERARDALGWTVVLVWPEDSTAFGLAVLPFLLTLTNVVMMVSPNSILGNRKTQLDRVILGGMLCASVVHVAALVWVASFISRQIPLFQRPRVGFVLWAASFVVMDIALLVRRREMRILDPISDSRLTTG